MTSNSRLCAPFLLAALAMVLVPLPASAQQGPPPASVRVAEARRVQLAPTIQMPGTVISRNDARLASEIAGRLVYVAEVGTPIEAGDPVARIDDRDLALQMKEYQGLVAREQSRMGFLKREAQRLRRLAAENVAAKNRLDEVESDLSVAVNDIAVAQARLDQIRLQMEKSAIVAPFPGVVTERLRTPGEHTGVGDEVARLIQPDSLEVVARAPLGSIGFIAPGTQLAMQSDWHSGMGKVRTMVPFGDGRSHMFELRIDISPVPWRVGESVRLAVPTAEPVEVLAVPRDALVLRRDGATVFRVREDGTAERVSVQPGLGDGMLIGVTGGLNSGDRVVVRGAERLRPGQPVRILDENPDGAG
jgi:RND family efflux transporter MFP subunit